MEIADQEGYPTAITALGSLFELTEVYLWDEGSQEIRRGSSLPKHIIFKYDDDEDVNEGECRDSGIHSNLDVDTTGDGEALGDDDGVVLEEDMDLSQQMSALGLPLSFQTSKDKTCGPKRGKRRDTGIMSSCSQEKRQDGELLSAKFSENEKSVDQGFKNTEKINLDDMVLEEDMCNEASKNLPSNDGTTVENNGSCMVIQQPQSFGAVESSDTFICNQEDGCYYTGSFGDWRAIWDSYYTRNYFYNVETQESTWYPPPGMEHLAVSNMIDESNADLVRKDPDLAISSNESDLTCKSSEGECGTDGRVLDQHVSSSTINANESEIVDEDCFGLSQPCSSVDIPEKSLDLDDSMEQMRSNGVTFDKFLIAEVKEFLIAQVNDEEMEAISGEVDNEFIPSATKRKKKAKKSRSKKKSARNDQEQEFQCSVDAYYVGIGKYWCQRYRLFSRFDQGIKMDEEGWFSVTPETIASHQASRCGSGVIVDCFAGAGGNAIQFAKTGRHVIAIDIDPKKIEYAKHNAAIYGVEDQIDFVIGDSFSLATKLEADTVFMSPPWGGPEYSKVQTYSMDMLKPHDGQFLFDTFKETASTIVMFLPRNVDVNQLAELCLSAGSLWSVEVERNFLNDKLKAVTAYFRKASV